MGTEKGLNHINRKNGEITSYQHQPNNPQSLKMNPVKSVLIDSAGEIWTGTWRGGMSQLNQKTGSFTHYPDLAGSVVQGIVEGSDGLLWVATDKGLSSYDREKNKFHHYASEDRGGERLPAMEIYTLLEDSKGILWLGRDDNLSRFDRKDSSFQYFEHNENDATTISAGSVRALFEDSAGNLWVGTGGNGVNLLNQETHKFTRYTTDHGLADNKIGCMLEDAQGRIWIGTGRGISRFNLQANKFHNYTREHGLAGNLHKRPACTKTAAGEFVFGSTKGVSVFDPLNIAENLQAPPTVIIDFKLFNRHVEAGGKNEVLQKSISKTKALTLDYNHSVFSFDFVALNYTIPEKNEYAYQLVGFDSDWVYAGSRRSTTYTNIDPGDYIFRVRGSNNEGVWDGEGISIPITILPPWWQTWWAYTLYVLAVIAILARLIYSQYQKRKAIEEQNRILELKVTERTHELHQKNVDIQCMLSNMRQGLFTIDPGGKVNPEYSHYLESIFSSKNIAGHDALNLLFTNKQLQSDAIGQTQVALDAIIGEEAMFFDFNAHVLTREYRRVIDDEDKSLSLDWNAIVDDGIVKKIMVTVRDVTELRRMESESVKQKLELDIISQIIKLPAEKYRNFDVSCQKFIDDNRSAITNNARFCNDTVALLFRNMHTIKGNSRTLGFDWISECAHQAESHYSKLKHCEGSTWDSEALLCELNCVELVLIQYRDVHQDLFGREGAAVNDNQFGIVLDGVSVNKIQHLLDAIKLEGEVDSLIAPVQELLDSTVASSVEHMLDGIVGSLEGIAKQLHKPVPRVQINDEHLLIKNTSQNLITDVFSHLMRNSIDHGIESSEVRLAAGKPAYGTITIESKTTEQIPTITGEGLSCVALHISDDGQGINIKKLFDRGVDLGQWDLKDAPSLLDITQLLFASGVSTRDDISDISGRGVGMNAVKQFLLDAGGDIHLELPARAPLNTDFIPFKAVISLPESLFIIR